MESQSLYKELAPYYDLIYSWKDYKKESEKVKKLILKYKKSKGKDLLEVGCGTGKHLLHLNNEFRCKGIDLNEGIIKVAKEKVRGVDFKVANMIDFSLDEKFDIITCLFSAIGYTKTYENLKKTINNFSNHLKEGGVAIIEPWFTKSSYKEGIPSLSTYDSNEIKIARLTVSRVIDDVSVMDMNYLVAEVNKDVKHFVDRHELGLFDIDKTLKIMKDAGLKAKFLKNGLSKGRGLFICVKK